ncbi:hypothetical protein BSKO_13926 [Bryopsis sp. KO-2023]|nr:hypothetical protein BSKO_13926 [Bryopsis sp. KO-2023]
MEEIAGAADSFFPDLENAGGRSCVEFAKRACSGGELHEAEILSEICWEKIHTGHWKDVDVAWRDAYALSQILVVDCTLRTFPERGGGLVQSFPSNPAKDGGRGDGFAALSKRRSIQPDAQDSLPKITTKKFESLLKKLDMAAMMGGARFRAFVDSKISYLEEMLSETHKSNKKLKAACAEDSQFSVGESNNDLPLPDGSLESDSDRPHVERLPSLEDFFLKYMIGEKPCIVDGIIETWPAFEKWRNPGYFKELHGFRTVPIEVGRHYLAPGWKQELVTFSDFIDSHIATGTRRLPASDPKNREGGRTENAIGYLAQHPLFDQIPGLQRDIRTPDYCSLGEGEIQSVNAWFGPPFTITPLHYDPHHNLLSQVVGRKYVRLYPPSCTEKLLPFEDEMRKNSSQIDLDRDGGLVDMNKVDCILAPGQMLYIPPKWWHYVKALDVSFSVSFWWK